MLSTNSIADALRAAPPGTESSSIGMPRASRTGNNPGQGTLGPGTPIPVPRGPSPVSSGSLMHHAVSLSGPMGLTTRLVKDGAGYYLIEEKTGMRIDVIDDPDIPDEVFSKSGSHSAAKSERDVQPCERNLTWPGPRNLKDPQPQSMLETPLAGNPSNLDTRIARFVDESGPELLNKDQLAMINRLHRSLATGQEQILSTTSINNHAVLVQFWDNVAARFEELHDSILGQCTKLDKCVSDNVKALQDLGVSEALLAR
ncbi:hypothetical protein DFH07DRAFT_783632 [Mycena maculata]|uniref:Uncharacterized protein n=1 Tax=Mycena maculata TaxID=230809 RepID=A0AAD7MMB7_9AGAR|nr:hypothetical protein DFH07DRAFT_783632 [Mycena maculata]